MSATQLESERLRLVVRDPAEVIAWIGSMSPSDRAEVSEDWLARVRGATAYGVAPQHQGRGYATEAARIMVDYAFGNGVRIVRAHTLPELNASTRVLSKCGFECVGEVVDPDDGLVWRFEIRGDAARESQG